MGQIPVAEENKTGTLNHEFRGGQKFYEQISAPLFGKVVGTKRVQRVEAIGRSERSGRRCNPGIAVK
jgi:hypothetical protein